MLRNSSLFRVLMVQARPGISLVEMLVAVALLSLVSIGALQLIRMTETTMLGEQAKLNQQQKSAAVASYVYKDFIAGNLAGSIAPRTYRNTNMPSDLQDQDANVTIVTLFGNQSRFNGVDPICSLLQDADLASGSFSFQSNCLSLNGEPITTALNELISKGITITSGLEEGVGRCSITQPIAVNPDTGIATVTVADPACLKSGAGCCRQRNKKPL